MVLSYEAAPFHSLYSRYSLLLAGLGRAAAEERQAYSPVVLAAAEGSTLDLDLDEDFDDEFDQGQTLIFDPLEPFNRAAFVFNDRLYYYIIKPAASAYGALVPEPGRVAVKRFFSNLTTPVRLTNCLLQLKLKSAATELLRFTINTTYGIGGLRDPAYTRWKIRPKREDTGQTLGRYGLGPGFYINWPVLGASSLRDSFGMVGDYFLDPRSYLFPHEPWASPAVKAYDKVNELSLNIDFYDDMKKDAFDPYTFFRDAYHQHRESLVKE